MLPDATVVRRRHGRSRPSIDARIADQKKLLDELMRRYTEQHPDVVSTQRLIAQLEEQKKQELEARRKAAVANPGKFTPSTNPVFQKIKISLAKPRPTSRRCARGSSRARRGWHS